MKKRIAFVGGGNMATCLVGGLIAHGTLAASIVVADPAEAQRRRLQERFGVQTDEGWVRLSVGAASPEAIAAALPRLGRALRELE